MKDYHFREYYFLDNDVIIIRDSYNDGDPYCWLEHPATVEIYQAVTDHLGSIIAVYDKSQRKVYEASYDAWTNSNDPDRTVSYWFTYDKANRMTAGMYYEGGLQTNNKYNEHLTYDANGNICSIHRYGKMHNGYYGYVDDLKMTLTGNRLIGVTEKAKAVTDEGSTDYKGVTGVTTTCTYNGVGSLTSDEGRGIALIEYDAMNNPKRIQFTNGNVTKYIYSATGEKLRTIYQTAVPNITVAMGSKHELTDAEVLYKDSVDYYHGGKLTVKNGRLDKCYFDGGYAQASPVGVALNCKPSFFRFEEEGEIIIEDDNGNVIESSTVPSSNSQPSAPRPSTPLLYDPIYKSDEDVFAFYYYTADHLGNIREVINEDGAVEQITNYYPFGTPFAAEAGNTNPDLQNHKYNGKEFDTMHGLNTYDYGARQYNSLLGRWDRMDPLCEKYYSVSPYAYCANNPVLLIDPNGEEVINGIGSSSDRHITDPEEIEETLRLLKLTSQLRSQDGKNSIMIVAHGYTDDRGQCTSVNIRSYNPETKKWQDNEISNGEQLGAFLSKHSKVWQSVKNGRTKAEDVHIVFYACKSAGIMEEFSNYKDFKDVTFIAPNKKVLYTKNQMGKYSVSVDNTHWNGKRYVQNFESGGYWITYRNGKAPFFNSTYPGDENLRPGTAGFKYNRDLF